MQRRFLLFGILVLLVVAGYGVFYAVSFYTTRQSLQAYENYQNIFRNDTYGGKTPEETLQLFVVALKANDIDKAVLYFMPDDTGSREKWRRILNDRFDRSESLAVALENAKKLIAYTGEQWFEFFEDGKSLKILLTHNGQVWKIESL